MNLAENMFEILPTTDRTFKKNHQISIDKEFYKNFYRQCNAKWLSIATFLTLV